VRAALRYELMRIRTIRSTWWLTGLAFCIGVLLTTLMSWAIWHDYTHHGVDQEDLDGLGAVVVTQLAATGELPSLVAFLLAMVGIFAWGHEYRHGMIRASLTALRSRTAFWVAKYLVCVAWAVVVAFVTMLVSGLVATLFLHDFVTVFSSQTWGVIGRELIYVVILTSLGMAFTSVTRSQAFALVTLFLWPLLVEHLVQLIFVLVPGLRDHSELTRFLPFAAGNRLVDVLRTADSTFGDPLSPVGGGLVFGAVAVVLAAASYVLFQRRDA
jgi:ABC-type transport system involved in multi-copper enzyme maturation permease subunit